MMKHEFERLVNVKLVKKVADNSVTLSEDERLREVIYLEKYTEIDNKLYDTLYELAELRDMAGEGFFYVVEISEDDERDILSWWNENEDFDIIESYREAIRKMRELKKEGWLYVAERE